MVITASQPILWPKLAGQNPKYLASQLYEFRKGADGNRNNAVMYGIALTLSDSDIEDLSAYYASLNQMLESHRINILN